MNNYIYKFMDFTKFIMVFGCFEGILGGSSFVMSLIRSNKWKGLKVSPSREIYEMVSLYWNALF